MSNKRYETDLELVKFIRRMDDLTRIYALQDYEEYVIDAKMNQDPDIKPFIEWFDIYGDS